MSSAINLLRLRFRSAAAPSQSRKMQSTEAPRLKLWLVCRAYGDHDRAISALQKLLSIPHIGALASGVRSPALLQLDPMFMGSE